MGPHFQIQSHAKVPGVRTSVFFGGRTSPPVRVQCQEDAGRGEVAGRGAGWPAGPAAGSPRGGQRRSGQRPESLFRCVRLFPSVDLLLNDCASPLGLPCATTKCHQLGGLNDGNAFSHSSGAGAQGPGARGRVWWPLSRGGRRPLPAVSPRAALCAPACSAPRPLEDTTLRTSLDLRPP